MMNKKSVLLIAAASIVTISALFIIFSHQRRYEDVLMRVVIWTCPSGERNVPIYDFIVKNDGTLISYYGLSRSRHDHSRTHNFIRSVQEREKITLSEEEFRHVSELLNAVVENYHREFEDTMAISHEIITLFYDGNTYGGMGVRSMRFQRLVDEIFRLAPLNFAEH